MRLCFFIGSILCALAYGPSSRAAENETERLARALHERGLIHYNLGEFDKAITDLKRSYELSGVPAVLFNIAQAQRLNGELQAALFSYRTFLRLEPDAPNRRDVEARIAQLEEALRQQPPETPTKASPQMPAVDHAPAFVPPTTEIIRPVAGEKLPEGELLVPAGLVAVGVGVALMGTGVLFGLRASRAENEINDAAQKGEAWSSHLADVYDRGETAETTAVVVYVTGGLAVAGGLLATWMGLGPSSRDVAGATVAPIGRHGVAVTLGGCF